VAVVASGTLRGGDGMPYQSEAVVRIEEALDQADPDANEHEQHAVDVQPATQLGSAVLSNARATVNRTL
jgi:hypothetical protein